LGRMYTRFVAPLIRKPTKISLPCMDRRQNILQSDLLKLQKTYYEFLTYEAISERAFQLLSHSQEKSNGN
jgi:hypothetical protein